MAKFDFIGEAPEQYEQKCLCVLCVDTSGSMAWRDRETGNSAIDELNQGLASFKDEIENDSTLADRLEIAVVEFNSSVKTTEPCLVQNLQIPTLHASGSTNLTDALQESMNLVDARKNWYKSTGQPYYRPWIILITDGAPDSEASAKQAAIKLNQGVQNKQYTFLPIGVQSADMEFLHEIEGNIPAMKLDGLKFSSFFQWLSNSMGVIARSQPGDSVNIKEGIENWAEGVSI